MSSVLSASDSSAFSVSAGSGRLPPSGAVVALSCVGTGVRLLDDDGGLTFKAGKAG